HLDAIVELIGGIDPALTYICSALQSGLEVITANKQLIAARGPALAQLGPLRFEASVASAIPIVETLAETLAADRINSLMGILNGTTNSILDAMAAGADYADALADAQRRGLAEADRARMSMPMTRPRSWRSSACWASAGVSSRHRSSGLGSGASI